MAAHDFMAEKARQWQGLLSMASEPGAQLVHVLLTNHTWENLGSTPQASCLNNTLPPARSHRPKVPQPLQTASPAGEETFRHMSLCETVHIQVLIEV